MARRLQASDNENPSTASSPQVSVWTWGLRLRTGGFALLELGPTQWLALLSPGVVAGLLVARLSGGSFVLWGMIGGVLIWLLAVSIERLFAGNRPTRLALDSLLGSDELERIAEAARHAGIRFEHRPEGQAGEARSIFVTKTKYVARLQNLVAQTCGPS